MPSKHIFLTAQKKIYVIYKINLIIEQTSQEPCCFHQLLSRNFARGQLSSIFEFMTQSKFWSAKRNQGPNPKMCSKTNTKPTAPTTTLTDILVTFERPTYSTYCFTFQNNPRAPMVTCQYHHFDKRSPERNKTKIKAKNSLLELP